MSASSCEFKSHLRHHPIHATDLRRGIAAARQAWEDEFDDGPATAAGLQDASSMVLYHGSLYLADFLDCVILAVDQGGSIHRVAGIGCVSFNGESTGDGGPAVEAGLARPADIGFGPEGSLYILEHFGGVRRVALDGTISTLPLAREYEEPLGMAIVGNQLYIADRDHHVIIRTEVPN